MHRITYLTECMWCSYYTEESNCKPELERNEYRTFNYNVSKNIQACQEYEGEYWDSVGQ